MAIAERGILGLPRTFPGIESGGKITEHKPHLYSEAEISKMMIAPPPLELRDQNSIETPVGTWSVEEGIVVFDAKKEAEIAKITKISVKRRLAKLAVKIFQMS
ncbi:MAG TPA: hypothetical protein VES68_00470 [Candidatus Sulfotelmatobacter sp.]|nr:hypothetical protein [Candidatus Sulfotelmatobacter sp.]